MPSLTERQRAELQAEYAKVEADLARTKERLHRGFDRMKLLAAILARPVKPLFALAVALLIAAFVFDISFYWSIDLAAYLVGSVTLALAWFGPRAKKQAERANAEIAEIAEKYQAVLAMKRKLHREGLATNQAAD